MDSSSSTSACSSFTFSLKEFLGVLELLRVNWQTHAASSHWTREERSCYFQHRVNYSSLPFTWLTKINDWVRLEVPRITRKNEKGIHSSSINQGSYKKFQQFFKDFSRITLDFQGPPTRNIISQIVQKCTKAWIVCFTNISTFFNSLVLSVLWAMYILYWTTKKGKKNFPVHYIQSWRKVKDLHRNLRTFQGIMEFKDFSRLCEPWLMYWGGRGRGMRGVCWGELTSASFPLKFCTFPL